MNAYRDGHEITLCDTCYRVPPVRSMVVKPGRVRSLRMRDQERIAGEGINHLDSLHFCNTECAEQYEAPRRRN